MPEETLKKIVLIAAMVLAGCGHSKRDMVKKTLAYEPCSASDPTGQTCAMSSDGSVAMVRVPTPMPIVPDLTKATTQTALVDIPVDLSSCSHVHIEIPRDYTSDVSVDSSSITIHRWGHAGDMKVTCGVATSEARK
jgi:hypothetical protein